MKKISLLLFVFFNVCLAQQQEYEVINTAINSSFAELGATYLSNNTLLFASSKKNESDKNFFKDRRRNNGQSFLEFYIGTITEQGDIIETGKFSNEIKNKFFEADIAFSPDYKSVYFTWNNYYSIETKEDVEKWKTLRIVKATIDEQFNTSNIQFLPFNSDAYSVRSPLVSNDGTKLFFVSDMPGGYGDSDIYYVDILSDGTFGAPINLGAQVNSAYSEQYPTMDANGTLYFSTIANNGFGGLDIFKSELKDGSYQKAIHLPAPINTKYDEFGFIYNPQTNAGFFTSNRKESIGNVDIFAFVPKELLCNQTLVLNVIDQDTKLPISDASMSIQANNNPAVTKVNNNNTTYSSDVSCNTSYKITIEKEHYYPFETTITTNNQFHAKRIETFALKPLNCTQLVDVQLIVEDSNTIPEDCQVLIVNTQGTVLTKTLNGTNKFSFEAACNTGYKLIATATNYQQTELEFTTDATYNAQLKKELTLTKLPCTQTVAGTITNQNNQPITANVSLLINNKVIEQQTTNKYHFKIDCNSTYIILVEAPTYNHNEVLVKTGPGYGAENTVHISLTPKACDQTIEGTVVSSDLNYQLNPVQVALYEGTNLLKTVTSTNNQFTFQVNCNTTYTIVASSEHFESNQVTFSTTSEQAVELPKNMVLNPKICTQKIEVIAFNSSNNVQLNTAKIALYHQQKLVEEAVIVNTNSLFFNVQCNANYTLVCEAPTFETTEITFQTDASFDTVSLQKLYVKPQPCLQNITFSIFNKETKEPLQGATLTLFNNTEQISLQQLTTNKHAFEVACNNNYTLKVALEKFNTQQVDFITTNTYNETLTRAIYLTPATDYITLGGQKLINTNTIYFDLDKADIRYDAAIELNKVVSYLTNNPHVKIEVKSHTDSRAPDSYNLKLSNNRAQSVINYIISKGIDASRVDGKGYGETQLLNHCANGVKCSEAEHQLNRRTEFVIIE